MTQHDQETILHELYRLLDGEESPVAGEGYPEPHAVQRRSA